MSRKINKILLYSMIMLCYSCVSIADKNMKEIYVVYDDSYTSFVGSYDPTPEYEIIEEGYELVIKDPPDYECPLIVYRRPFNRRYWFIGKFLIDKDKNISFVPVTSSKNFDEKKYKKEDIKSIKSSCFIFGFQKIDDLNAIGKEGTLRFDYYDVEKKKFIPLTKDNPKYENYFLYSFGFYMPSLLVIKNDYGKQLMENGTILPDPNELKNNIVWQDWYNYWGLTDYKIEIP